MDVAIERAMEMLEESGELEDTLLIVTSDHGHTMSFNGYSYRGSPVVGNQIRGRTSALCLCYIRRYVQSALMLLLTIQVWLANC